MIYEVIKGDVGTQWWVVSKHSSFDTRTFIKAFDDKVKAQGYIDELRKADNDRLYLVQEEGIQTTERSEGMVAEREEELRRE